LSTNPDEEDLNDCWETLENLTNCYLQTMLEDWKITKSKKCKIHSSKSFHEFYNNNLLQKLKRISPVCNHFIKAFEYLIKIYNLDIKQSTTSESSNSSKTSDNTTKTDHTMENYSNL